MFDKIIWHVGSPKTGSKYLQRVLCQNKSFLFEKNFIYQTDSKEICHGSLFTKLSSAQTASEICESFEDYFSQFRLPKNGVLIISQEIFADCNPDIVKALSEKWGRNSQVVEFVRSPASYCESAWKQWHSKNNQWLTFQHYIDGWAHPAWGRNLRIWKENGAEIKLLPYIPRKTSIVSEFASGLGKEINLDENCKSDLCLDVNLSYNATGQYFADLLKEIHPDPHNHHVQKFLEIFGKEFFFNPPGGVFSLLSREEVEAYNQRWMFVIKELEELTGTSLCDILAEYDKHSLYEVESKSDRNERTIKGILHLLYRIAEYKK